MSMKKFLDSTGLGLLWDKVTELLAQKADNTDIPTNVSQLENDAGYLTSFTETDPTVPAWAKAQNKPAYTAQEVGAPTIQEMNTALADKIESITVTFTVDPEDQNTVISDTSMEVIKAAYHDGKIIYGVLSMAEEMFNMELKAIGEPQVFNVYGQEVFGITFKMGGQGSNLVITGSTNLNNNEVSWTLSTINYLNAIGSDENYNARNTKITNVSAPTDNTDAANKQYVDTAVNAKYTKPAGGIPASDLAETYLTSFTETDPTVPQWAKAQTKPTYTASEVGAPTVAEMNTAIGAAIGNVHQFELSIVQELPTQDIDTHTIYLVPKTGETNDIYDEYVYINDGWEMIGNTQIDLSGKADKADTVLDTTLSRGRFHDTTIGTGSFAFGNNVTASGNYSHAEGSQTTASKNFAHAEGTQTIASQNAAHAEGSQTTASGFFSHAEGTSTTASQIATHAEGVMTTASQQAAHAEGTFTIASAINAHAEGGNTIASAVCSHAEGIGTEANAVYMHAQGAYNILDTVYPVWVKNTQYNIGDKVKKPNADAGYICIEANEDANWVEAHWELIDEHYSNSEEKTVFVIGNGTTNNLRSNALRVDWDGNEYIAGNLYVNSNTAATEGSQVATIAEVEQKAPVIYKSGISPIVDAIPSTPLKSLTLTIVGDPTDVGTSSASVTVGPSTTAAEGITYTKSFDPIYEGTLDFVSGKLTITKAILDLGSIGYNYNDTYHYFYSQALYGIIDANDPIYSSDMTVHTVEEIQSGEEGVAFGGATYVYVYDDEYVGMTIDEFKAAVTGKYIAYTLRTPRVVELGATAIRTLDGTTYVMSDDGAISVEYQVDTKKYVDLKANKIDTVLDTTLSMGRKTNSVIGNNSTALGSSVEASGLRSFAEGYSTIASGIDSHAEGRATTASGEDSHAEGYATIASGRYSHVSGKFNVEDSLSNLPDWTPNTHYNVGDIAKIEFRSEDMDTGEVLIEVEKIICIAENNDETFDISKWEYSNTLNYAEIVGNGTRSAARSNARALDWNGNEYLAGDLYVHANVDSTEGVKVATTVEMNEKADKTDTVLNTTLSMGRKTNTTVGLSSVALGSNVEASGYASFAENMSTASGLCSHAEGLTTTASGISAHAEGEYSIASGRVSHASGRATIANGAAMFAVGGVNVESTIFPEFVPNTNYAVGDRLSYFSTGYECIEAHQSGNSLDFSKFKTIVSDGNELFVVGNSIHENNPSNAMMVDIDGNEYLAGDLYVHANTDSTSGTRVATVSEIPNVPVQDIQLNGSSILSNGVANVPKGSNSTLGVVKGSESTGVAITNKGTVYVAQASDLEVKSGTTEYRPIVPSSQHKSIFYGLAKLAGADMKDSSNAVGTYTDAAKQAIQNMLGITSLLSTEEASTATAAHAANSLFLMDGKLYKTTSAIAVGDAVAAGTNCQVVKADEVFVKNTDYAIAGDMAGIVKIPLGGGKGIDINSDHELRTRAASGNAIKNGQDSYCPITPYYQHESVFYGLAKAAGTDLLSVSGTVVGTYTTTAATAIKTMLQVQEGLEVVRLV